jgi:hypothetical protein
MASAADGDSVPFVDKEGAVMGMLFTVLSIALVVAVLGMLAFVLLVEPFLDHAEQFRDPRSGQRLGSSPRWRRRVPTSHLAMLVKAGWRS